MTILLTGYRIRFGLDGIGSGDGSVQAEDALRCNKNGARVKGILVRGML